MNVSSRPIEAQGGASLLDRTHRFLTEKARPDVETAADRFFFALGYTRRADDGERLVFERGRPFASFYSGSIRGCRTRLELEHESGRETGVILVRHRVSTRGRLLSADDVALFDVEARAFERFLERADLDTVALLEAARRSGETSPWLRIAATGAVILAIAATIGAVVLSARL